MQQPVVTQSPEIRELHSLEEFAEVVNLQRTIWGFDDVDLLPLRMFVVASKIGGQVLGAYVGHQLVAFCLCLPGMKPRGKSYLHSQMLGVLPQWQNSGVGRRMKLVQREYALTNSIELIEWTFDPLELKNAHFNIERLGAIIRRFVPNQYGTTTSHLHGSLPTDRLVPEWWVQSRRVQAICAPTTYAQAYGAPQEFARPPVEERLPVPADIAAIRESDGGRAQDIQSALGEQFEKHFRAGLAVIGFERSREAGTYLLGEWESN